MCRFRAKYGVCFQSESMRIVRLGLLFLWVWALQMAFSRVAVSFSSWNSSNDKDVPVHDVLVSGSDENTAFSGSSKQYILTLSGRFLGLQ